MMILPSIYGACQAASQARTTLFTRAVMRVFQTPKFYREKEKEKDGCETQCLPQECLGQGVSVVASIIGSLAVILPPISPYFKYSIMINKATPHNYPVPILDDENMPDVPSHPKDSQGPSLEWPKNLQHLEELTPGERAVPTKS
ncbi:NADH dehydrogenase [ubiquinone] 1 alpha subcomplex subunit 3 [Plecturocebus cupreus]